MKPVLVIRTSDKEYGEKLANNFNRSADSIFQTYVFSETEAFEEFAKTNIINVLLCDEDISIIEGEDLRADLMINLTEASFVREDDVADGCIHTIIKFQPYDDIIKEVKSLYRDFLTPDRPKEKAEMLIKKLRVVCSPIGGAYSSTFALALASYYSQTGPTIFLTFDPFFVLPNKEKDIREGTLSDLWLYLSQGSGVSYPNVRMAEHIRFCASRYGNLELLNSVSYWYDICDIDEVIMHNILDSICNTGVFQNAVFDLGFFGKPSIQALEAADIIYVPTVDTPLNQKKIAEFKRQLSYSNNGIFMEKIRELNLPVDEGLKGEYDYSKLLEGKLGRYIAAQDL
ncbi:MAG: hypothetical protein IKW90_09490 [Lachnospiraceae bacterium]|nr:hypothetical protein [Lachnospiraceae bacterium]